VDRFFLILKGDLGRLKRVVSHNRFGGERMFYNLDYKLTLLWLIRGVNEKKKN
jgi:hypothetical protein